jgi:prephenate dehydrogenase
VIADSTIAIVGLGLMGGSLARAVSARGARVLGYDRNPEHLDHALREGVVHEALGHDLSGMEKADVVVLALPVDATCRAMTVLTRRATNARLLMDLASTKQSVVSCAESAGVGERFVGAHPLTGSHRSGWSATQASLFEGARVFRCGWPNSSGAHSTRTRRRSTRACTTTRWRGAATCRTSLPAPWLPRWMTRESRARHWGPAAAT